VSSRNPWLAADRVVRGKTPQRRNEDGTQSTLRKC